jgi:hypothetical protein
VGDAALPLLNDPSRDALVERLETTPIRLRLPDGQADTHNEAFLLAVNLAARIYPRLVLEAPGPLAQEAFDRARSINPLIEFEDSATFGLSFEASPGTTEQVNALASGWNVAVDGVPRGKPVEEPSAPALLAAATLGMAAVFRSVFADSLPRPRISAEPGSLNLVSTAPWTTGLPLPKSFDVGRMHLVGAGAIGQAALLTFSLCGASGDIVVVDPQAIEESNLQRYVLSEDRDIEAPKVRVASRVASDELRIHELPALWGEPVETSPCQDTVLVALDSWAQRIEVQGGLHRRIFNAYTGPLDVGWSRHEAFAKEPCLACMYWPNERLPDHYELVAQSLKQSPQRVRRYLTESLQVGQPLTHFQPLQSEIPNVAEVQRWLAEPILNDLGKLFDLRDEDWSEATLEDFYSGVVCGGAGVRVAGHPETTVPLAHQSMFAGLMLATQLLVASDGELVLSRPDHIEGRLDLLKPLPRSFTVPTSRHSACICQDPDFAKGYEARWVS